MPYRLTAGVCTLALTLAFCGSAFAFDCFVAKKPPGAGSAYSVGSGAPTPLKNNPGTLDKPHGAFLQITAGGEPVGSTFTRAPDGVLPPARDGGPQHDCDGKGIDSAEACGF